MCDRWHSDTHDIIYLTAHSPWSQGRHTHTSLLPSTWTSASPVPGICYSIIRIPPEYGGILASYLRRLPPTSLTRPLLASTNLLHAPCASFPPFPVTLSRGLHQYCDSLTRTLYPLWPTLEYRECGGLWIVGEDSSPVSRLLSSLCPGIVRHDESVPDIAHPSVNSLTLRSLANVLTETAGCSWLRVWPDDPTPVWSRRIDTCGRQLFSVQKCTQLVAGELFTLAKQNMVT